MRNPFSSSKRNLDVDGPDLAQDTSAASSALPAVVITSDAPSSRQALRKNSLNSTTSATSLHSTSSDLASSDRSFLSRMLSTRSNKESTSSTRSIHSTEYPKSSEISYKDNWTKTLQRMNSLNLEKAESVRSFNSNSSRRNSLRSGDDGEDDKHLQPDSQIKSPRKAKAKTSNYQPRYLVHEDSSDSDEDEPDHDDRQLRVVSAIHSGYKPRAPLRRKGSRAA